MSGLIAFFKVKSSSITPMIKTPLLLAFLAILPNCCGAESAVGRIGVADYGDWKATGTAFQKGPAAGQEWLAKLAISDSTAPSVISSEVDGDGPLGTLTSPEFKITQPYLSFRIGGGDYERHACIDLLINGKVVKSATGRNSDRLTPSSWAVREFMGKTAQLQIIDHAGGQWGHINVEHVVQTDDPEVMPLDKGILYQESLRPQFHFTARQWTMDRLNPGMRQEGWLNDLNGLIYYAGEYHLFAQRWNKCWIHAVSRDLIHWQELAPAFWEEHLDSGVQSGTCVIDDANTSGLSPDKSTPPMVAFWSRNEPSHCISYSLDHGRSWQHYAKNPVLVFPERDPKVFWYQPGNHWVMMMYGGGKYHLFTSANLLDWKNENHPINDAFECPDFFELPVVDHPTVRKWALIHGDGKYSLGTFNGREFKEETPRYLNDVGGQNFYATQTFDNTSHADGRRIQLAWIRGSDFPGMPFSQQVSFPCELTLHETPGGLRLFRQPIRELDLLQRAGAKWTNHKLKAGEELALAASGQLFRIRAEVSIPEGAKLTFSLRGHPVILTSRTVESGTGPHATQGSVKTVEILLDRASVETFVNQGEISSTRYFLPHQDGLSLKAENGVVIIHTMTVTELQSAWTTERNRAQAESPDSPHPFGAVSVFPACQIR